MHDGMPYGRNQGQDQGHSREVDHQSPTGLIFVLAFIVLAYVFFNPYCCDFCAAFRRTVLKNNNNNNNSNCNGKPYTQTAAMACRPLRWRAATFSSGSVIYKWLILM